MDKNTIMFDAFKTQKTHKQILEDVYCALKEKDYNPIDQLVGYLISGDPSISPVIIMRGPSSKALIAMN